jgi:tRNA(Ile2) C34 agmatinyltransferase TiaS
MPRFSVIGAKVAVMITRSPGMCPFCRSFDVRVLTALGSGPTGYRCHDCQKTFFVTAAEPVPVEPAEARTTGDALSSQKPPAKH